MLTEQVQLIFACLIFLYRVGTTDVQSLYLSIGVTWHTNIVLKNIQASSVNQRIDVNKQAAETLACLQLATSDLVL